MNRELLNSKDKTHIIASRRETSKYLNENFCNYIKKQTKSNHGVYLEVEIAFPTVEKCLLIVDFISWAVFRKIEHGDDSYYNIIKSKIIEINP
jgi:hypothetical protein